MESQSDEQDSQEYFSDEDESDSEEESPRNDKKSVKLLFEQSENEKFRAVSRTKTPFFVMSEQDEVKEGLELIKEISCELDEIFHTIPKCDKAKFTDILPVGYFHGKSQGLNKNLLPKPTRRDVAKDSERWVVYKSSIPNDFSSNKTFSFS